MTAIFDFDGTLLRGDSFISFARRNLSTWRFYTGLVKASPWLAAWKLRLITSSAAKMRLFGFWYKGSSSETFERWGREYASYIDSHLIPATKEALSTHLNAGDRVYIISASLRQWIAPWAEAQGDVHVIATMPGLTPDKTLTGRFDGPNCLGEEKVKRLQSDPGYDPQQPLTVYTDDTRSDRPLILLTRANPLSRPVLIPPPR